MAQYSSHYANRILVVEPTSSGGALLKAARQLGIEVVVASHDRDDREISPELREQIDTLITLDTNDEAALTEAVLGLHRQRPLLGIMPGFEFYVDIVAHLAARVGVPGLPVGAVEGLRDKSSMRRVAYSAGLRVPRYAEINGVDGLDQAAERVGYPCVLKPTRSAGSVHVSRVDGPTELRQAYEWMLADTRTDMGRELDGRALLEEYVEGPEVSVEGYVTDDEVVIVSITAKLLGPEPNFVEVGHIVEMKLPPEVRDAIETFVRDVCRVLGVTLGPFHCELRVPADEPVLIEIGARLAGDHICDLVEIVTGISLPRVMLATYAGLDFHQVAAPMTPRAKCAGIHFFTAAELPVLAAAQGLDELRCACDTVEVELYLGRGEAIALPKDFRCRIGHVIYTADSYEQALERWHGIGKQVRFE